MKQKHLKVIRVVFAILMLLSISALFVDFREIIPTRWADRILFLQFVPSVIRFITIPAVISAGFIVVVLLTLLFGRVYCSVICPLGIFQDIFTWISKKTGVIKRFSFKKALNYLRYPFLALTILFLLFGSLFILNLLDPYSSFGRIFSDIVRPGLIVLNNGLAGLLERFDNYTLFRMNMEIISWRTVFIPIITLALIITLAALYGRIYCNTVCPAGTILGFISRIAIFKIHMDQSTCSRCGKCSFACKANCISVKNMKVDHSRCVACYNCITVCPENSIKYRSVFPKEKNLATDSTKRAFVGKTLIYGMALFGLSRKAFSQTNAGRKAGNIPNTKKHPVTPPGSVGIKHFTSRCTACHLCVSACPTGVLQPSYLEYGLTGMGQPKMDFNTEYCNYECTKCGEVCPTGAILPLTVEEKKLEQTGLVHFILNKCVVYTDHTACGSCSEHCPTQAVKMVAFKDGLTIPETDTTICIGCGACEFACPVRPHTAIFVDGNEVHQVAKAPHIEELDVEHSEDFLF